jgi:NADH dehydrogenase FAD-containing subunit
VEVTDDNGDTVQKEYPFDVVSVDIGSTTRDLTTIPGAQQYTISTRPISDLVRRIEKEEEILKEKIRYVNRILDCGLWIIYISFNSLHFQLWCN